MGSNGKRKIIDENRKFSDLWTEKYFFVENNNKIICLICNFAIAVCKEYNLKRHYETKHKAFAKLNGEERIRKIESLRRSLEHQKKAFVKSTAEHDNCVYASFQIAALIAKTGRPFTDGDFAKNCIMIASEKICPEATQKLKNISLNRMTVQRRIENISDDISEQLQDAASNFRFFSLAADESTDISSTAQLLVFVRGISDDFVISEELLGMSSLKSTTTGSDLLQSILELCTLNKLDLKKLVSITTDGAPSMKGVRNGMVSLLAQQLKEEKNVDLTTYHCIIHQEQLCAKVLGFERLMKLVTDAINFIKSKGLNHRQFKEIISNSDAHHNDLAYYCEVRWLSRGDALKKFADLYDEIVDFLKEKGKPTRFLEEETFRSDLAFLVDITGHLNDLNKKLMGKGQLITQLVNAVSSFKLKLKLFTAQLSKQNFVHFPYLHKIKEKCPNKLLDFSLQLKMLQEEFNSRFQDFETKQMKFKLFSDPFGVEIDQAPETFQMELIDLQTSDLYKAKFRDLQEVEFFKSLPSEFSNLKENASMCATMFGSTYICEQTFSLMNINKSKLRSKLTDKHLESVLRISSSNIEPNISKLVNKVQCQPSH